MPESKTMTSALSAPERKAVAVLAGLFVLRMLGIFLLLPVLALYAAGLPGAAPISIGLAVGAYGVTQAALQIPFGALSDRFGRRRVIAAGLILFAAGSVLAATAEDIGGLILGRALQGAGAISAAVLALLADHTRSAQRTRAMAFIGVSIGAAFAVSLVAGPALQGWIGVPGIFWMTAGLALLGVLLLASLGHRRAAIRGPVFSSEVLNPSLLVVDLGVFVLHLVLTATFVALPFALRDLLGIQAHSHWWVYIVALLLSLSGAVPMILVSERMGGAGRVTPLAIGAIAMGQLALTAAPDRLVIVIVGLAVFFAGFNFLEARLPAMLTQRAPTTQRGVAAGVYTTSQFLGAFVGGVAGGWVLGLAGIGGVFGMCVLAGVIWLAVLRVSDFYENRPSIGG